MRGGKCPRSWNEASRWGNSVSGFGLLCRCPKVDQEEDLCGG